MTQNQREVKVSKEEMDCLKQASSSDEALSSWLQGATPVGGDRFAIGYDRVNAERLRDLLTRRLAEAGFDESYNPTEVGRLLEDLIDRFFQS